MKNLYARLGITPTTTQDKVQIAIRLKPSMAQYGTILLNPKRREIYDRTHYTLSAVGQLRARLELDPGDFWFYKNYSDFSPSFRRDLGSTKQDFKRGFDPYKASRNKPEPATQKTTGWPRPEGNNKKAKIFLYAIGALFIFSMWTSFERGSNKTQSASTSPAKPAPSLPSPSREPTPEPPRLIEVPLPETGSGENVVQGSGTNFIYVSTKPNGHHTLVKIEFWDSRNEVASKFVRAGETVKIAVPLGNFRMKTASGRTWFGPKHLFGADTQFSVANSDFPLNQSGEYWEVELIPQISGNLSQRKISASEF